MRLRCTLVFALAALPGSLWAQSLFDGTWIIESDATKVSDRPEMYTLDRGRFCCVQTNLSIKADGLDHKVAKGPYVDTEKVRVVDDRTVEVVVKKAGKVMFTTTFVVSEDRDKLTAATKDTTEAEAVFLETLYQRVQKGPTGAHALSGSWRGYKTKKSANGSIITYKCTDEGFSAETPLGEKYYGKFDGKFYPTEDDPGHTLAAVKRIDTNTVELTQKREGKITGVLRLTVSADGKFIHGVFERKDGVSNSFEMRKQP